MDQIKIGKFISERRRAVGLTQMQLAERLNITDRAVSKWERGRAMPDSSIMLDLCSILGITVNDLLSGEAISMDKNNYNEELEKKVLMLIAEKEANTRRLLTLEWVIGILSTIIMLAPIIVGAILEVDGFYRFLIITSGLIPGLIGLFFAVRIEQVAGYYKCKCCGHSRVPSFKEVFLAQHYGRTRKLRCPSCGKKCWHKKVVKEDE